MSKCEYVKSLKSSGHSSLPIYVGLKYWKIIVFKRISLLFTPFVNCKREVLDPSLNRSVQCIASYK